MLHTPLWKRLMILALVAWGILASIPNLFYKDVEAHNDAAAAIAKAEGVKVKILKHTIAQVMSKTEPASAA